MRVRSAGAVRRRRSAGRTMLRMSQRVMLAAGLAAAVRCAEPSSSAPRLTIARRASFAVAPTFDTLPSGVPVVQLSRMRGVMVSATGDSVVAAAPFEGDSAVLVFDVELTGGRETFQLTLDAYDLAGAIAYESVDTVIVRPGRNPPVHPRTMRYAGPDADVATIRVVPDTLDLPPGARATLGVSGTTHDGRHASVPIRVGWLSRADSVATVDATGAVHASAVAGTTWVVARSASGAVDSAVVRVR